MSVTPLADALAALAAGRRRDFHALPWAAALRSGPAELRARYAGLYGDALAACDMPVGTPALDSPVRPTGPLRAAQDVAAAAFGADATHFTTGGTSLANRIMLDALGGRGRRLLVDGAAHQSVFFAAAANAAEVVFTDVREGPRGRHPDVAATLAALDRVRPDAVVLTGATYDGRRVPLRAVLAEIGLRAPGVLVAVDEAWSALHGFAARTRRDSALPAAAALAADGSPVPPLVVSQSAHKTLCALRQASYLHVRGPAALRAAVGAAVLRHQTTSPSWPLLASLDLARAHAESTGEAAVEEAVARVALLRERLAGGPAARLLDLDDPDDGLLADPTVLALATGTPDEAGALRRWLSAAHATGVPRVGPTSLVVRMHAGTGDDDVEALATALERWCSGTIAAAEPTDRGRVRAPDGDARPAVGAVVDDLVLPYPPGVPLARPGDVWTTRHDDRLDAEHAAGTDVLRVPGDGLRRT